MIKKKYEYWFFYIKPEYQHEVYIEEEDSLLYAYTDNKEIANMFLDIRDMKKFIMSHRNIKRDVVNFLARVYPREYLSKHEFLTKVEGSDKYIPCNLALTKMEYINIDTILNTVLLNKLWKYTWTNPEFFHKKYQYALSVLGFFDGYCMIVKQKENPMILKGKPMVEDLSDILERLKPDYVSAFIHHYSHLLNDEYKSHDEVEDEESLFDLC